jgi:acetyl-CoA carboxylase biotin carboxyl carrier protein
VVSKSSVSSSTQPPTAEPAKAEIEDTNHLVPIKSPMVGTFYRAPAPDAKSYVELNQQISVGEVVCIIEAMKLMNEIEAEVAGRVAKILVENAKPVEFGQTLFLIEPA